MPRIPQTNSEIIDAFGGRRFGEVCGFARYPEQRASDMRRRDSINSRYWPAIVAAAEQAGLPITLEILASAAQRAIRSRRKVA